MGMERVLLTMQAHGAAASVQPDVFVVHAGDAAAREGWKLAEWLRDHGRTVVVGNGGSFKSQMKKADASGARYAAILGDDEVGAGKVTLKALRAEEPQALVTREAFLSRVTS